LSRSALAAVAGHEVHLPGDLEERRRGESSKSKAAGFDAHVLKPATVEELTGLLARRSRQRSDYR